MRAKAILPITDEIVSDLARQLVAYRLDGCPSGGAARIQAATRKAASKIGRSYGELWARVHAAAYEAIDASGQADLRSTITGSLANASSGSAPNRLNPGNSSVRTYSNPTASADSTVQSASG